MFNLLSYIYPIKASTSDWDWKLDQVESRSLPDISWDNLMALANEDTTQYNDVIHSVLAWTNQYNKIKTIELRFKDENRCYISWNEKKQYSLMFNGENATRLNLPVKYRLIVNTIMIALKNKYN